MLKLIFLLFAATLLAHYSEQYTGRCLAHRRPYYINRDTAYVLLNVLLVWFTGLRTGYNDTWNYINSFRNSLPLEQYLQQENVWNIFKNPAFYFMRACIKSVIDNPYVFIFLTSLFTQTVFLWFLKRYSRHFTFSVFLYIAMGTFCFSMAAVKQVFAMAVLLLGTPFLEKRQWGWYLITVLIASQFHTYALAFAVLPLFYRQPWHLFTYLFVALLVAVMMNFEGVITAFLDQADEFGKSISDAEVLDENTLNILRVLVYSVTPAMSFLFRRRLFRGDTEKENILVHMSIISASFMIMGTQSGANMFARMATYFEMGTLCCLPWMINRVFNRKSARFVTAVASVLFLGYFLFEFGYARDFGNNYNSLTVFEFLRRFFASLS